MMIHTGSRQAATLVELIMGIAVMMIATSLAVSQVVRHQRAYAAVAGALNLRARLRDGSDLLAADLRGSSPAGDSILVASDTAVEFFSAIGTATLCATPAPNVITLPPDSLSSGRVLSSWVVTPEAGDDVVIFVDSAPPGVALWQHARIETFAAITTSLGCPVAAGLLSASDVTGGGRSYQITLAPTVSVTARGGAPVRIVRRVRYSVYRGGDRKWYLGYRRCSAGCAPVQPVSGPYESPSNPPISFRYFTRAGAPLPGSGPTVDVGRIDIVFRATYAPPFRLPGMIAAVSDDSLVTTVALRNAWP